MHRLVILKEAFADNLKKAVAANLVKYERPDSWVSEVGSKSARELDTSVELREIPELELPTDERSMDLENAIRIHKALRFLKPLQACDRRLWTRLTHAEYWTYMRRRWPVERHSADKGKATRFVESRYFVPQRQSRALLRNGIARLWWTAQMTHDPERANPYELTAVLLSSLDIAQQILERNFGRASNVTKGFLEFLIQHRDVLLTGGDANRARIRQLAKYLNVHGGVCILDCLTTAEIIKELETELPRIMPALASSVIS